MTVDEIVRVHQDTDLEALMDDMNGDHGYVTPMPEFDASPKDYEELDLIREDEEADLSYDHWREDRLGR